ERARRLVGAAVDPLGAVGVEGRVVEVVRVERLLRELERLGAQRRRALGAEPLDGAYDLGRVAGARLTLEERAVAREGLALGRGEPIVAREGHGGGDQAVRRAAGEEERVEGRQEAPACDAPRPGG